MHLEMLCGRLSEAVSSLPSDLRLVLCTLRYMGSEKAPRRAESAGFLAFPDLLNNPVKLCASWKLLSEAGLVARF